MPPAITSTTKIIEIYLFIPYEIGRVRLRFVVLFIIYNITNQFHSFVYFVRPRFRTGFIPLLYIKDLNLKYLNTCR